MNPIYKVFPLLLFVVFCACTEINPGDTSNPLSTLTGKIIFPHAGDIFEYDLSSQNIDFLYERKGRQGPFFSPDGNFFATNNWPASNEGVAIWDVKNGIIKKEFELSNTLLSDQKGVKVAKDAAFFSAVINPPLGREPNLIILDADGNFKYSLNGEAIRYKGHVWDANGNLFISGELLIGNSAGTLFIGKISDFQNPQFQTVRTFTGNFRDLPDELAISRDGTQIAYAYKSDIWVGPTSDNPDAHRVCFEATQSLARPTFSPDGTYLAMVMLNSNTSLRGDIHVGQIPSSGSTTLTPEGASLLPGPNSSLKSTWTSGDDSSIIWIE